MKKMVYSDHSSKSLKTAAAWLVEMLQYHWETFSNSMAPVMKSFWGNKKNVYQAFQLLKKLFKNICF